LTSDLQRAGVTTIRNEAFRFEFAEHNCFACGTLNRHGLGLELHLEPGRAWTEIVLDRRFEGWEGVAHGGIIATILDEVMAWSLVASDNWGVTARLAVAFRQPVRVDTPIRAEGWITTSRRRLVDTAARIVDVDADVELATATAVYAAAGEARKRELQAQYGFRRLEPALDVVR
jgi:acyl-coenzyme A thioesterase PaaI-like protein